MAKSKHRDELVFFEDIYDCAQKISKYIEDISETEFLEKKTICSNPKN